MTRTLLQFRVYSQSQSNPRDNTAREPSIEDHLTTHGHERFHQRILTVGPEGAGMRSEYLACVCSIFSKPSRN